MAAEYVNKNLKIEGANIFSGSYRNFGAKPDYFNPDGGISSFCVALNEGNIEYGHMPFDPAEFEADGWNVKFRKPRHEDEEPTPFIRVRVRYGNVPPKVVLVTSKGQTFLDEDTIGQLDYAEIVNADVVIRPYTYSSGKVAAYLKTLYVTIAEDDFADKYDI